MANQADLIAVSPSRNPSGSRPASVYLAGAVLVICLRAGAEDVGLNGNLDLRPAAEAGDPVARYRLGKRYHNKACNLPRRTRYRGAIRMAPSSRIVSPFSMVFSRICATSAANSSGSPSRGGNGVCLPSESCAS